MKYSGSFGLRNLRFRMDLWRGEWEEEFGEERKEVISSSQNVFYEINLFSMKNKIKT